MCQSDIVGFSEFITALFTENAMSDLIHLDKYINNYTFIFSFIK